MKKLFILRKFIKANSAEEAIKKDKVTKPDEIWVDEDWKKDNIDKVKSKECGFKYKK